VHAGAWQWPSAASSAVGPEGPADTTPYPSETTLHPLLSALASSGSATVTTVAQAAAKSGGGSILDPIARPIARVLEAIYAVIPNYGVAIMILSVIWMLLIAPLTLKSTRSMLAMQKLQPQLKKLQDQYKDDKQAFAQAQMELFREHNVSPFGSCLPMLLPMPVFFALFRVIDGLSHTVKGVPDPKYLSPSSRMFKDIVAAHGHIVAFGMDLSKSALNAHGGFLAALPFWIALLIMAGTSYLQSAQMMNRNPASQNNPQARLMKFIPVIFAVICARFPAGVIVYYAMSNVCRIVQQDAMYRFDPKVKALVATEVAEVEELYEDIHQGAKGSAGSKGAKNAVAAGGRTSSRPAQPQLGSAAKNGRSGGSRSRFGELLAAAAEQRKAAQARSQDLGSRTASTSSRTANGTTNQLRSTRKAAAPRNEQAGSPPLAGAATPARQGTPRNKKRKGR